MASTYPTTLDALVTTRADADATATNHVADHNNANDAINKIEAELGLLPKGTFATVRARLDARLTARVTADQTFTTATLANVTNMSFAVASGQDYYFKFIVPFTSAATTTGLGLGLTCPALTGFIAATVTIPRLVDTAGTTPASSPVFVGQITSSGDSVVSDASPAITVVNVAIVEGILSNPSASGTLQLQAKTEVAASNIVLKKGAYGEIYLN
jgi:hypothetical protein